MTVMVSLVGEQPIPNLLVLRDERPDEAVLVFTERTKPVADRLQSLVEKDTKPVPLPVAPYDIRSIYEGLKDLIEKHNWPREGLVFNLTGGTKTMVLAAYQIAAEIHAPFLYLQSEGKRSRLYRYKFNGGAYSKVSDKFLPALIGIDDYIQAYLGQTPQKREKTRDAFGQAFEEAIAQALREINLEVKVGVHLAGALEVDLIVRYENQVGVIQAKTGGAARKKTGLDQLNAVCDQRYLGTYTAKMLVINEVWDKTRSNLRELAEAWRITLIELPSFTEDSPHLSDEDRQHLQTKVVETLGPAGTT